LDPGQGTRCGAGTTPKKKINPCKQRREEDAADIEQDVPDIANEPVERDSGEQRPDPPIFEE
jgi:hypothetical protein